MFNHFINKTWENKNCFKWTKNNQLAQKSLKKLLSALQLCSVIWPEKRFPVRHLLFQKQDNKIIENRPNTDTLFELLKETKAKTKVKRLKTAPLSY